MAHDKKQPYPAEDRNSAIGADSAGKAEKQEKGESMQNRSSSSI
jgi:hypothetical protein